MQASDLVVQEEEAYDVYNYDDDEDRRIAPCSVAVVTYP